MATSSAVATVTQPVTDTDGTKSATTTTIDPQSYSDSQTQVDEGLVVETSASRDYSTITQPLANGVRNITVLHNADAPTSYAYKVKSSDGALTAVPMDDDGALALEDAEGSVVTTVQAPWALDSANKQVRTWYTFSNNTLTQHVDTTDPSLVFPVVADPQWGYTLDLFVFRGAGGSDAGWKAARWAVDSELHTCFNCSFPIRNAPRAFPSLNQVIPLDASPFTFITVPAPVRVNSIGPGSFGFRAEAGHFDGADSTVFFRFYNSSNGALHLNVNATVKVDRGAAANAGNRFVAQSNWQQFINVAACKAWRFKQGGSVGTVC